MKRRSTGMQGGQSFDKVRRDSISSDQGLTNASTFFTRGRFGLFVWVVMLAWIEIHRHTHLVTLALVIL